MKKFEMVAVIRNKDGKPVGTAYMETDSAFHLSCFHQRCKNAHKKAEVKK